MILNNIFLALITPHKGAVPSVFHFKVDLERCTLGFKNGTVYVYEGKKSNGTLKKFKNITNTVV